MKYILFACALLGSTFSNAQTLSGSIKQVGTSNTVTLTVKPSADISGKILNVTFPIAIPKSASPSNRPVISIDNLGNSLIVPVIQNAADETLLGVDHYIYNIFLTADGTVPDPDFIFNYTAGVDNPVINVSFNPYPNLASKVKLVSLIDGGSNQNSFFGFSVDGVDCPDENSLFYSIPTFSAETNNAVPGGYSGYSFVTTLTDVPLPVRFLNFNVTKRDNTALLNWSIENENSLTANYQIERSLNGVDFLNVATIQPKNNGNTSNSYDFTDVNISSVRSSGVIYYRIKQVDRDGKTVYTEIKNVRLDSKSFAVSVFPNPVKSTANISIDLVDNAPVSILIIDAAGKQVQTINLQGFKGLNTKKISMDGLAAGNYLLKVKAGEEVKTIPVVKSN